MSDEKPKQQEAKPSMRGKYSRGKLRNCLVTNCKRTLRSKYPGLCKVCKQSELWQSGYSEYEVAI